MIGWVGSGGVFHVAADGATACGARLGGEVAADHPCEACVSELFALVTDVPGLVPDEQ